MEVFIFLLLIFINGIFVLSEIALISARKSKLETQANKGDEKARQALKLLENPERFLSTAQIGLTLVATLTSVYSEEKFGEQVENYLLKTQAFQHYAKTLSTIAVVLGVTVIMIIFGELIPKKLALMKAEKISRVAAGPFHFLTVIMYPFVWFLSGFTNLFFKLFNIRKTADSAVTEEEIKAMITEGSEQGSIEEDEKEIIERVFHLGDRNITSLMTHRTEIVWVDANDTVAMVKEKLEQVIYSTYPVCNGSIDEINGIVYVKDLLKAAPETTMKALTKEAIFVPENNSAYQLLEKIKTTKIHACFIVNEYGTMEGMITLNDILEAIVGDVPQVGQEEYEIIRREDGTYLTDALIQFYDFLTYFDRAEWMNEVEHEFDTLAGFVLHELEHIPVAGEKFKWRDFEFEIIDMDGQRIDKILVTVSEGLKEEMEEGQ